MIQVALPDPLRLQILQEARAAMPRECCGLLEGVRVANPAGEEFRVTAVHPARNLAPACDRFEIAPEDHIQALKAARANGCTLIGCYHSHPQGRAEPSQADARGAEEEDFVWLISASDALAAFVYRRGAFCAAGLATPG